MSNELPPTDHAEWVRWVNKQIMRQGARGTSAMTAVTTGEGQPVRVPVTPPDNVPTEPPVEAPTVQVVGFEDAMTVEVRGNIAPTTLLDYYLDDVLVATTTATVLFATKDKDGLILQPDTDYTWVVVARNALGSKASLPATVQLRPGVTSTTVLGWVSAGFALLGALQVGQITLEPPSPDNPGGLRIPLLNGGLIHFPADGSDAIITAILRARSLIVEDHFSLYGEINYLYGGFTAANGVNAPGTPPRVGPDWLDPGSYTQSSTNTAFGRMRGLYDNGSEWIVAMSFYNTYVYSISKTTGLLTSVASPATVPQMSGYQPFGGITKIGAVWFVLAYRNSDSTYWVQRYDSGWNFLSQWSYSFADTGGTESQIATDGTSVFIARMASPAAGQTLPRVIVRQFTTGGTLGTVIAPNVSGVPKDDLSAFWVGAADFGGQRFVLATLTSPVMVFTTGGTRQSAQEWVRANSEDIAGLSWDGTRFHSHAQTSGRVWAYSRNVTSTARTVGWTRWNSTLGWETTLSPTVVWNQPPRQWMRVDTDPPGNGGDANDPDTPRIYINAHRQTPDLAPGVTTALYDLPGTAGAAPPATNTFPALTSPGYFQSDAEDTLGKLWKLSGAGIDRLEGITDPLTDYTTDLIFGATTQTNVTKKAGFTKVKGVRVRVVGRIVFTGAIAGTGALNFKLPTGIVPNANYGGPDAPIGRCTMVTNAGAVTQGTVVYSGGANATVYYATGSRASNAAPFAWGTGCSLQFDLDFYL